VDEIVSNVEGWCCGTPGCSSYLEELVVGGGLGEAAAVLDGLLELGGLGDHVCGNLSWVVGSWECGVFGWDCCREELESGMPNDVISAHPQLLDLVGRWTAGLIIRLHRDDALGIK
jgi:hypothetical protein